jgi:hypothetical protein
MKDIRIVVGMSVGMSDSIFKDVKGGSHLYDLLEKGAYIKSISFHENGKVIRDEYNPPVKCCISSDKFVSDPDLSSYYDECISGNLCDHIYPMCHEPDGTGYVCTRKKGHTGNHIACNRSTGRHNLNKWD